MAVFRGRIRRWREDKPGGRAVADIPLELAGELGGRRQMPMADSLNGVPFHRKHDACRWRWLLRWREPGGTSSIGSFRG